MSKVIVKVSVHLLTAPKTPEEARTEAIERAESGEYISLVGSCCISLYSVERGAE